MALTHEWMFYEVAWRNETSGRRLPQFWWEQQYFRHWPNDPGFGLFDSKEAAFACNALYRYWNMVGVKEAHQESLVGQAGEIEPVYDTYTLSFFVFDPATRMLHMPQYPEAVPGSKAVEQSLEDDYLPVILTRYRTPTGVNLTHKTLATTVGIDQRCVVLVRMAAQLGASDPAPPWLCLAITPAGPTGFQRRDKTGQTIADRRINFLKYLSTEQRVLINSGLGPLFDAPPAYFGTYGNGSSWNPDFYLANNPFEDLSARGTLNGWDTATDNIAGLCSAVFAWPMKPNVGGKDFELVIKLPVDDYRGPRDFEELRKATADMLEANNRAFWTGKLDQSGLQATLPPIVSHLFDVFRICRANLLILSDGGEIHPGPTIYDSFWIRDSSVEGIACALAGDGNLSERQFGTHYPKVFNVGPGNVGPAALHGFFGGDHEKNDLEWDSNGQALWAFGRFDRIRPGFGSRIFSPYVIEGARWLRDNRSSFGLLFSGWSAEHIGGKDKPHYWDDFWALAGLWEAARIAERLGLSGQAGEIWSIYNDLNRATADSIRWVLGRQRQLGDWETFIPTGPADAGCLDSTMIGAISYFHPTRLYMGAKLGTDIDSAARMTLDTIWSHFVDGGFRHDAAWHCYGPYLTLQLAHAFLLTGDQWRMDKCLEWSVWAGSARVNPSVGTETADWQVVLTAWNEQHCYPIAKRFSEFPDSWYMGDIPHGWACAELILLLRDILFFEADEDDDPHVYIAPGVLPRWLDDGQTAGIRDAPTIFGRNFGYRLAHHKTSQTLEIDITQALPANVWFVFPCRFGSGVQSVVADGKAITVSGRDVHLPAGTQHATIKYL